MNRDNLDESCPASHDFYQYSNGTWLASNPIPDIYPAWGSFLILRDENEERCKKIITQDEWKPNDSASAAHTSKLHNLCKTFYAAGMDEAAIDALSSTPLSPLLAAVDSHPTLTSAVADLHSRLGVKSLFGYGSTIDKKESSATIAGVGQGGLGLPDRDYYTDADKKDKCDAYVKHVERMLALAGVPDAGVAAGKVFEFEKAIAVTHMTKSERRDVQKTYNLVTISELDSYCPAVDWTEYLRAVHGLGEGEDVEGKVGKINLSTVDAMKGLG